MFALVYCKYTTYFTNDAACATALRAVCYSKPHVEKKEGIKQNKTKTQFMKLDRTTNHKMRERKKRWVANEIVFERVMNWKLMCREPKRAHFRAHSTVSTIQTDRYSYMHNLAKFNWLKFDHYTLICECHTPIFLWNYSFGFSLFLSQSLSLTRRQSLSCTLFVRHMVHDWE